MGSEYVSRFVTVQGIKTHFLEAGAGNDETLVLLHPGEYGASAELSWQETIDAFAETYHVIAPDMIGFGKTDKLFDFGDAFDRRIEHLSAFLETMNVTEADFIGNSMGGGYLASVACEEPPLSLPIRKMIVISGGGGVPDGFGEIIREFDGTEEQMAKILDVLFYEPEKLGDDFLTRKTEESRIPGHWQSLSAIRFEPPFEQEREFRRRHDYESIDVPTLLVGGEEDELKPPSEIRKLGEQIPGARVELLDDCAHCAHMERPETFNELAFEFFADD
ncbi:alpha/beta fold hydrolase [Halobellus sp. GM3]|uniref:alpha/beta fold hydrolase n=1 Tax=Halobellus sp. GM3 TaxID=3458410 RepID=UPI00403D826F